MEEVINGILIREVETKNIMTKSSLPVGAGIEHQKLDVFHCQCEGLARTG